MLSVLSVSEFILGAFRECREMKMSVEPKALAWGQFEDIRFLSEIDCLSHQGASSSPPSFSQRSIAFCFDVSVAVVAVSQLDRFGAALASKDREFQSEIAG